MVHSEYAEQCKVFEWAIIMGRRIQPLAFMYSSQSGERLKSAIAGARAKRAGMRKGVPDIFLPLPCVESCVNMCGNNNMLYAGLYIELKKPKTGKSAKGTLSDSQKEFLNYLNAVGYKAVVCYGAEEAIGVIKYYLSLCGYNVK